MLHDNAGTTSTTGYNRTDILTPKETASYLRVSEGTLGNWRYASKGPRAIRLGDRSVRYRFGDLEDWIAASTEAA